MAGSVNPTSSSNTLATLDWFAQESLRQLYINCVAAQLCHRGYDAEFKGKKGDTARILKPLEFTSEDFSTTVTVQDADETYVSLKVDKHKDVTFAYTSVERALKMPDFQERYIAPALKAHAEQIDKDVIKAGRLGFYSYYGTPGTTPTTKASLLQARKNLQTQKAPLTDRKLIMGPSEEAEYLDLFSDASTDGSTAALREASLGRRFGLDTYMDQNISDENGGYHTPGTLDPGAGQTVQTNAEYAAGTTTVVLKASDGSMTGTLVAGDILEFSGCPGSYVVTALATAAANVISVVIDPALPETVSVSTNVTILGQTPGSAATPYTNNLLFHRGAIALAFASLPAPEGAAYAKVVNYKGFALRLIMAYDASTKQEMVSIDCLYGAKAIDPRLGTRWIG